MKIICLLMVSLRIILEQMVYSLIVLQLFYGSLEEEVLGLGG